MNRKSIIKYKPKQNLECGALQNPKNLHNWKDIDKHHRYPAIFFKKILWGKYIIIIWHHKIFLSPKIHYEKKNKQVSIFIYKQNTILYNNCHTLTMHLHNNNPMQWYHCRMPKHWRMNARYYLLISVVKYYELLNKYLYLQQLLRMRETFFYMILIECTAKQKLKYKWWQ